MDRSPDSIRVVTEADFLDLGQVARSTWKNWAEKGLLEEAKTRLYDESEVVEVVAVAQFVSSLDLNRAKTAWKSGREAVLARGLALPLDGAADLDAVIDAHSLDVAVTEDASSLHSAVHAPRPFPRGRLVLPLADLIAEARRGFWKRAEPAAGLAQDKRRKAKAGGRSKAKARRRDTR